jgi:hypothetical protein
MPVRAQLDTPELGRRMLTALRAAAGATAAAVADGGAEGSAEGGGSHARRPRAAIVIGTDVPGLTAEVLSAAARALADDNNSSSSGGSHTEPGPPYDAIIGPSEDGGYYLIGLSPSALDSPAAAKLFDGIPWSTPAVAAATREAARAACVRLAPEAALPRLRDVDTVDDLRAWVADEAGSAADESELLQLARRLLAEERGGGATAAAEG